LPPLTFFISGKFFYLDKEALTIARNFNKSLTSIASTWNLRSVSLPTKPTNMNCKPAFYLVLVIALAVGCTDPKKKETTQEKNVPAKDTTLAYFGDTLTPAGAIASTELGNLMKGKDSLKVKLSGTIEEVCQKKGCWLNLPIGNEQSMRVKFKDYAFFVPKDAAGKEVIIEGYAYTDTISVAALRHYAEDEGKTKEEIKKINQPEINISFEANGVILKK